MLERTAHPNPRLLIINGLPASGKSTLARKVAPALGLPLHSKDVIKELLFDQLGWGDRERSKQLGSAAWELIWAITYETLRGGGSLAIESNFDAARAADRIETWRREFPFHLIELHCRAEREVLVTRFRDRALGPHRHPGHCETDGFLLETEFFPRLRTDLDQLIPGTNGALTVDTTLPSSVDESAIIAELRHLLWPS